MLKDQNNVKINFDGDSLLLLNIALVIIMFGLALNITIADFKRIIKTRRVFW